MDHPIPEDTLERFLNGKASRDENRAVVAHLLQGCAACSRALQTLAGRQEAGDSYEEVLDRLEKALAASLDVPVTVEARPARHSGRRSGPPRRAARPAGVGGGGVGVGATPPPAGCGPARW
ncbi:MAG TPA: hypothetical protein VEL74_07210 [Thermoanaerobaculia bacterium]|nr:hypothetical protein [Thermoanaerobaculia bacterium]